MQRILLLTMILSQAGVVSARAQKAPAQSPVAFHQYEHYVEKDNSGLKGKTSFLVITSQKQFDKIFGPAAVMWMGKHPFLPEGAFHSEMVLVAIARGHFYREYKVKKVAASRGTLYVWYTFKDSSDPGATYASPLILAVHRDGYSHVVFMADGRRVGSERIP